MSRINTKFQGVLGMFQRSQGRVIVSWVAGGLKCVLGRFRESWRILGGKLEDTGAFHVLSGGTWWSQGYLRGSLEGSRAAFLKLQGRSGGFKRSHGVSGRSMGYPGRSIRLSP